MSKVERINFKKYELEALFSLKGGKMEWRFRELLRGVGSWDFFLSLSLWFYHGGVMSNSGEILLFAQCS